MKVRIDEQGFDKFNGDIGGIKFIDGVSEGELTDREVMRLSAAMRIVELESNVQQGASVVLANSRFVEADVVESLSVSEPETVSEPAIAPATAPASTPSGAISEKYTRESLEQIADKQGIAGIREIADSLDVKARSIPELIDGILKSGEVLGTV